MSLRDSLRKQSMKTEEAPAADISAYIDYDAAKVEVMDGLKEAFEKEIEAKSFTQTFHFMGTVSKYHYSAFTELSVRYDDKYLKPFLERLSGDLKYEFDEVYYELEKKYYDIVDIPTLVIDSKKQGESLNLKIYANLQCDRNGAVK
ncbi:hypothetical protein SAMN06297422_12220 [Lachnospiraceae bacterium]|nr:hypothetical protein SAMN06297422_12220 [Lachnospiraceae bacterium]